MKQNASNKVNRDSLCNEALDRTTLLNLIGKYKGLMKVMRQYCINVANAQLPPMG